MTSLHLNFKQKPSKRVKKSFLGLQSESRPDNHSIFFFSRPVLRICGKAHYCIPDKKERLYRKNLLRAEKRDCIFCSCFFRSSRFIPALINQKPINLEGAETQRFRFRFGRKNRYHLSWYSIQLHKFRSDWARRKKMYSLRMRLSITKIKLKLTLSHMNLENASIVVLKRCQDHISDCFFNHCCTFLYFSLFFYSESKIYSTGRVWQQIFFFARFCTFEESKFDQYLSNHSSFFAFRYPWKKFFAL